MNLYNWQIHITKTNKQTLNEKRNKNDSKLKHKQKQNETKKNGKPMKNTNWSSCLFHSNTEY